MVRNLKFSCCTLMYKLNLAPDSWQFPKLKEAIKGQHFLYDVKVEVVPNWIKNKPEIFFIDSMK